ncbi:MAG TPA: PLP-dependent aminotransferase family protein [Solirubrobacteraceae bacterium]|nr:PLP-dependent aminotransferase family protein [Solirubrobacteraceae bacterium]
MVALRRLAMPHLMRLLGDWRSGGVAYPALAVALRALIVEGRLPPYTRLPSERELALALGISRNTVTAALDVLREQRYLASRRGRGSWITSPPDPERRPDEAEPPAGDIIDLTLANLPAPPELAELALHAAHALAPELGGHGYEPFGLGSTRQAIADYLSRRGLATDPAQVLVTQGALHAWDLTLRTFARPGDRVLLETPTYPGALDAVRAHGCVPVAVPVSDHGWDLPLLRAALRDARPLLGYLIPDFQNPTGFWASARERAAVARAARAAGMLLVSDESLAELVLEPGNAAAPMTSPPSMATGDSGSGVLAVGSLSKPVWGGLRTGWLRAEPQLVRRLALARAGQDVGSPILDQLMAVEVLRRLDTLLPARRDWLRERRDALLGAVARERPQWRVGRPAGGMALWVELPDGTSASALAARAVAHGVRVAPGPRFGVDGGFEQRLRLPFTQPPERLAEAVRRLAAAEDALGTRSTPRPPDVRWVA